MGGCRPPETPVATVVGTGVRTWHGLLQGLEIRAMSDAEEASRAASEPSGCCQCHRLRGWVPGTTDQRPPLCLPWRAWLLLLLAAHPAPPLHTAWHSRLGHPVLGSLACPAPGHRTGCQTWRVLEQASEAQLPRLLELCPGISLHTRMRSYWPGRAPHSLLCSLTLAEANSWLAVAQIFASLCAIQR